MRKKAGPLFSFFVKRGPAFFLGWLVQPMLLACPVCFQVEQNATTDGLRAAVLVLIGVTAAVLSAFGLFIIRFVRRS
jgi:hypothetical protein